MQIFFTIYFFLIGALFASFFNVVGIRVYDHCSIMRSSQCPKCNHKLRWCDIIPIFGYLINGGKCHFCKEPIHIKYFLIEVFGGSLLALSFWFNGFSLNFLFSFLFLCILLLISVTFYEYKKVMNPAIYIYLGLALILTIVIECLEHNQILYMNILGSCVLAIIVFFSGLINPNNKRYFVLSIAVGFSLGLYGLPLFFVVFGIGLLVKLLFKKIPVLYIVSFASMISFVFSSGLFEWLTNIL